MGDYRIDCIKRDTAADSDRRIDRFGGPMPDQDGVRWNDTIDNVIRMIDSGAHRFWTSVNGKSVWCKTETHPTSKRKYVTTEGDAYPPNNLLKLPECS